MMVGAIVGEQLLLVWLPGRVKGRRICRGLRHHREQVEPLRFYLRTDLLTIGALIDIVQPGRKVIPQYCIGAWDHRNGDRNLIPVGLHKLIQKADIAFDPVFIGCQVFLKQIVVGTVNDPIVLDLAKCGLTD